MPAAPSRPIVVSPRGALEGRRASSFPEPRLAIEHKLRVVKPLLPITTGINNPMNQSELEPNTCNRRQLQARENVCEQVSIDFGFSSTLRYVTIFSRLLNLAIFPSEDLAATNFSDFDDFLKNFNNFRHCWNSS